MSAELDARLVVNKLKLGIWGHSIFDNDLVRVDQQNATPLARHWRILFSHSKVAPERQHRSDIAYAASHPRWDQITALMIQPFFKKSASLGSNELPWAFR